MLQSYILSTTTETAYRDKVVKNISSFNRTSFQQQLKLGRIGDENVLESFNRTSFQQQLKPIIYVSSLKNVSFNRTSFQQQLKLSAEGGRYESFKLQSYILSTTTETVSSSIIKSLSI